MQPTQDYDFIRISTGGLVYRLMCVLRLQDPVDYRTRRRIVVFVMLAWMPLFLLAMWEGKLLGGLDMPFAYDLKTYVRYFFVLPLLIMADVLIDPLIVSNIKSIGSSGIIGEDGRKRYERRSIV